MKRWIREAFCLHKDFVGENLKSWQEVDYVTAHNIVYGGLEVRRRAEELRQ